MKKYLYALVAAGALALTGCDEKKIDAELVKYTYHAPTIVKSSDAVFGNESVKYSKERLVLNADTKEGDYIISVYNGGNKDIVGLREAFSEQENLEKKVMFSFPRKSRDGSYSFFGKDRIGVLNAGQIEIKR